MVRTMKMVYAGSNYEDELHTVNMELSKHQTLMQKMGKIKDNLIVSGDKTIEKIVELQKLV